MEEANGFSAMYSPRPGISLYFAGFRDCLTSVPGAEENGNRTETARRTSRCSETHLRTGRGNDPDGRRYKTHSVAAAVHSDHAAC
jgi:hypothetical protein